MQVRVSYPENRDGLLGPLTRGSNISEMCSPDRFPIHGLKVGSFPPLFDAVVVEDFEKNISVGLFFTMAATNFSEVVGLGPLFCEFDTKEVTKIKEPVRERYNLALILLCPVPKLARKSFERKFSVKLRFTDETGNNVSPFLYACSSVQANYFVPGNQLSKRKVGACLLLQDKNQFIDEWIAYHRLLGIERIYVYLNEVDDDSLIRFRNYFEQDVVLPIKWPFLSPNRLPFSRMQSVQINDCLWRFRHLHDWLVFMDVDEFLQPMGNISLKNFVNYLTSMESKEDIGGLCVHNVFFGMASSQKYNPESLVIEQATYRQENATTTRPKTITRPTKVYYMWVHVPSVGRKCIYTDPEKEVRLVHYKNVDTKPPKWYPKMKVFDDSMQRTASKVKEQLRKQPSVQDSARY
ncbi:hypothetical protein Gasu2_66800 [Galdieria sulphuraria]|uniref:Glycosyltransferase family 92 protein n=1 Tax=Galdieria sulphuraria TaxID=130081 RepID=M2XAF6_GALSU|nr:uncharacterized protein Gasu_55240 [Galdieria sulphuraria]EME26837.1 hypothetical protein Gasu_55240 [Galdieria sulphuraria]GJD12605.1 hypothetical protein Gasu2_66800 [Galdieria sulphuraria]|eukprot:XP_005703357.1 hypothetical protein Gasu_55240 [Galdieria sulphuraria]